MAKTLIGINTLTDVDQAVYSNHLQFAFRLGRNHPEDQFILFTPRRMSIDMMRNTAAKFALQNECDYLMFIDDDVLVPCFKPTAYEMLKSHDKDIVAGWTIIRGYPFKNMLFKYTEEKHLDEFKPETKEGLVEVDAVGFSCVLIKCELLKKLQPPFFVTGPFNTEDIYFCVKAKVEIPETQIWADLSCKTGHKLNPQFIDPDNKQYLMVLEESLDSELKKCDTEGDRGDDYLRKIGEDVTTDNLETVS